MSKELQKKAAEHVSEYDRLSGRKPADVPAIFVHLTEEVGELAQEIYSEMSGRKKIDMEQVKDGVADIFMQLCALADKYGIDLEKAVTEIIDKDMKTLDGKRRR